MPANSICIDRRFCGPPNSANGGYLAGRLAAYVPGVAEVTLHRPPPLEVALEVRRGAARDVGLYDADGLIATAVPGELAVDPLTAPAPAEALAAAARTLPVAAHALPRCFVCGPLRDAGDGLRLHVGPLDVDDLEWNGVLAAPWLPATNLGDAAGSVCAEFVWAALDCPTAYACGDRRGIGSLLLGRQTVRIVRRPAVGEPCIVASVFRGRERRKHFAEAALFGADAALLAVCRAVWIEVSAAVQQGSS